MNREPDHRPVGLFLFLASLTTLIGAAIVGYLVVRFRAEEWPPPGVPAPPPQLWASTAILLMSSLTLLAALRAAKRGDDRALRGNLVSTLILAVLFLMNQVLANRAILLAVAHREMDAFSYTFLMLTGLHALHILGGLIPLAITTFRARRGAYGPKDHTAIRLVATYWHYLDAVWLVMFALLML